MGGPAAAAGRRPSPRPRLWWGMRRAAWVASTSASRRPVLSACSSPSGPPNPPVRTSRQLGRGGRAPGQRRHDLDAGPVGQQGRQGGRLGRPRQQQLARARGPSATDLGRAAWEVRRSRCRTSSPCGCGPRRGPRSISPATSARGPRSASRRACPGRRPSRSSRRRIEVRERRRTVEHHHHVVARTGGPPSASRRPVVDVHRGAHAVQLLAEPAASTWTLLMPGRP